RVPHVIVAVNKIDLVGYSEEIFADVAAQARAVATELGILDLHVLPVSALEGDNIVDRSGRTPWYDGPALLELLETLPAADEAEQELEPLRLPVQLVLRPQGGLAPELAADPVEVDRLRDYRAVAGRISSGTVSVGDRVEIFPSGIATTVTGIRSAGTPVETAVTPESVSLEFADDLDTARGAVVVAAGTLPAGRKEVDAELFQLDARTLTTGSRVLVKHGTTTVQAVVAEIESRYDLDSLTHESAESLATNDIGRVRLRLAAELPLEPYSSSRHGGSFLVIHPSDGATLAAGIARD
ncbi:MAG: sulfate adenylyltransferase, partial [Microbacterium sp.]